MGHLDVVGLDPDMFLLEWFLTLYSKILSLDVAAVIWDLFLLDGEVVLYCTALALLRMLEGRLLSQEGSDLEGCVRILNEELRSRACDPDEVLWNLQEVWRKAPPQLLAEIRHIENVEFSSTGASPGAATAPADLQRQSGSRGAGP